MDAPFPDTQHPHHPRHHGHPASGRATERAERQGMPPGKRAYSKPALEEYGPVPAITGGSSIFGDEDMP